MKEKGFEKIVKMSKQKKEKDLKRRGESKWVNKKERNYMHNKSQAAILSVLN